mmetsp:Transcript_24031/g.81143  ORF Transcript_24031/g.81143 Transcript_24031/m.81143 type:complete len:239 (+) Transcript_24031:111-827(+)
MNTLQQRQSCFQTPAILRGALLERSCALLSRSNPRTKRAFNPKKSARLAKASKFPNTSLDSQPQERTLGRIHQAPRFLQSHQDVVPALPCSQDLRTRCQVPEHRLEADFPGLLQGPRVQQRPRRHLGFRRPRALGRRCGLRSVVGLARGLPCLPLGRLPRRPRPRGALAALGLTQSLGRRTHAPALVLRLLCFLDLGEFGCRHPLLLQRRMLSHRLLVLILERRLLLSAGSLPKLCKL